MQATGLTRCGVILRNALNYKCLLEFDGAIQSSLASTSGRLPRCLLPALRYLPTSVLDTRRKVCLCGKKNGLHVCELNMGDACQSLEAYINLLPTMNALRMCHRYGRGPNAAIARLPTELITYIEEWQLDRRGRDSDLPGLGTSGAFSYSAIPEIISPRKN